MMHRVPLNTAGAAFGACLIALGGAAAHAQTLDVPTDFPTIAAAMAAATDGAEIRVRNNHVDFSAGMDLVGIAIAMRSYSPDFSAPAPGAIWLGETGTGNNQGYALQLTDASLVLEGFGQLSCFDCSMLVVGDNSTLAVSGCTFQGTGQPDTAPIDTGPMGQSSTPANPVSNISITIDDCLFDQNGRALWLRSPRGANTLSITNTVMQAQTSWNLEVRQGAGTLDFDYSDSVLRTDRNRTARLYMFTNTDPAETTTTSINIDRVLFDLSGDARAAMIIGGVEAAANPASSYDITVTNCVFDLREAAANAETSAAIALPEASRRSNLVLRHSTILTGDGVHSALRLRGSADSSWSIQNSIVDGLGTALKNEGAGSMASGVNLFNTDNATDGSPGTTLSGSEIIGIDPLFTDPLSGDFTLGVGSPAAGVGADLGVAVDFNGDPRPQPAGSNPDLGAFESPEGEPSSVQDWFLF